MCHLTYAKRLRSRSAPAVDVKGIVRGDALLLSVDMVAAMQSQLVQVLLQQNAWPTQLAQLASRFLAAHIKSI